MKEQTLTEKQLKIVKANPVKNRKLTLGVAGAALAVTLFLSKPTTNVHAAVVDGNHSADSVSQNTSNNDTKDDLAKTVDEQNETLQASRTDAPKASDFANQPQTAETYDDVQIIDHTQENGQNKQQEQPASNTAVTDPNEVPVIVDHTQDQAATARPDIPVEVVNGSQTDASTGQDNNNNDNTSTATPTKKKKGLQGRDGKLAIIDHKSENVPGDDSNWQNLDYTFDPNTNELNITGGTITNPKSINEKLKSVINKDGPDINVGIEGITFIGNISHFFGYNVANGDVKKIGIIYNNFTSCDFSQVIDMSYLFENVGLFDSNQELAQLDTSNVTDMSYMFHNYGDRVLYNSSSIRPSLDLTSWIYNKVTNMSHMFDGCNLDEIDMFPHVLGGMDDEDLVRIDTSKVTDMSYMFANTKYLISDCINYILSYLKTDNVVNMSHMFDGYKGNALDITKLDTSKVMYFGFMFANTAFPTIDLSKLKFDGVSGFDDINDRNYCFGSMFENAQVTKLDVSNFDFSKLKYDNGTMLAAMFNNCSKLTTLTGLDKWDLSHINNLASLFNGCSNLTNVDIANWNTHNVTDMTSLFAGCSKLEKIDVAKWDTSNVISMKNLFKDCSGLKDSKTVFNRGILDLTNWHTDKVTNMSGMFYNMSWLHDIIGLSNFNTSNVTDFSNMFAETNIDSNSLDLSNFDLTHADHGKKGLNYMLRGTDLKELKLGPKSILVGYDSNGNVIDDAGLDQMWVWIAVAGGTKQKPKGRKLYTSSELMRAWDGSQGTETFVITTDFGHDVKINYIDVDTKKVVATDTIKGWNGATIDYANLYHDQLVKLGKQHYIRDTSADTVKFDNNHDVMMPDIVTDGLSYNIGVKKQFNATINYVDLNTGNVIATDQVTGNSSTPIAYSAKLKQRLADLTKAGYTLVNGGKDVPLNADNDLQLPADISDDVTYTYGIRSQFPITINYVDETGKVLAHDELKGNIDTELPYKSIYNKQVAALKAKGYTVVDSDLAFNGQNKAENLKLPDDAKAATTFTVHLKAAAYNVTINYVDADTGKVVKTDTVSGSKLEPIKYADTRKQSLAELNNQSYVVVDDNTPLNAKGDIQLPDSVTDDVTYTVKVKEVHDVNVAYVDADTQKVLTSETIKGNNHKPLDYKSRYDELVAEYAKKGYELVKTDLPFDASGNIQLPADKHNDFNYKVYLREVHQVTVNYVDLDTGKVVKTDTVKGNSHTPIAYADQMKQALAELAQKGYTFDQKDSALPVDKNGDIQLLADLTGNVTYQVGVRTKKAPVSDNQPATVVGVIVHYRDNKGNQLAPDEQIVGQVGSSYLTHAKEIPGYTLETVRGHVTGTIGQQIAKVTYYYVKDSDKNIEVPIKPNDNNQQTTDNNGNKKPDKNGKHDNNKQDAKKPAIIDHGTVIINPDGKDQVKIIDKTGKTVAHKQVNDPKQAVIKPELPQTGIKNGWSMMVSGLTMILLAVGSALGIKRKDEK